MRTLLARDHRPFAVLLAVGVALRIIAQIAYQPALLYFDSYRYLANGRLNPDQLNPIGYNVLLLEPVEELLGLAAVAVVHHLLGLALAVAVYALCRRWGAGRWLGALAALPVLLDAYQLQIEQNVMPEPLFQVLVVAALLCLTWWPRPPLWAAPAAGLALGAAVTVRQVGLPMVVPAVIYLVWVHRTWARRAGAAALCALAFAAPLVAYAGWFQHQAGEFRITGGDVSGRVLYGRIAPFVDCDRFRDELPDYQQALCPKAPPADRLSTDDYVHERELSPAFLFDPPPGISRDEALQDFARTAIRHQPVELTRRILADFFKGFAPSRTTAPKDVALSRWQFKIVYPEDYALGSRNERILTDIDPTVVEPLARFLRGYQLSVGYVPPTLFGLGGLLGVLGALGVGRARRSGLAPVCFLWASLGLGLLLAAAVYEFSWRYQLPGLAVLPATGVLGWLAVVRGARHAPTDDTADEPDETDEVDDRALADFHQRYGPIELAPVAVVIAAYNEASGIGEVLRSIPDDVRGLAVDIVVVVDGATDDTAAVALAHDRAYTCVAPVNRGQGAALRLGYRIARDGGSAYIVTTDADGQYEVGELGELLAPLLADEADFVTGSRRLGRQETKDAVRHLGVRVFAGLVSVLTRQRITDTSNGFRAMRAEVTGAVTLAQPQYQASELLIATMARGFRVVEVPTTMRTRVAGRSKKGNNVVYGYRYGRVILTTWWRERERSNGQRARTSPRT